MGPGTLSDGVATYTTSSLSVATHHIVAKYRSNVTDAPSESAVLLQVVNLSPTTTELTSRGPSTLGQPVTFTVTVTPSSGATPAGTVDFYSGSGSTFMGTGTLSGGAANFTTSSLSDATHHIVAKYRGTATDAASESAVLMQVVKE